MPMEVIILSEPSTYDSILKSISDKVDVTGDDCFQDDLRATINMCFAFCHQFGCGPKEGFRITGPDETWDDYICEPETLKDMVKLYIAAKTKLTFDPPQAGPLLASLEREITKYEWYITNFR